MKTHFFEAVGYRRGNIPLWPTPVIYYGPFLCYTSLCGAASLRTVGLNFTVNPEKATCKLCIAALNRKGLFGADDLALRSKSFELVHEGGGMSRLVITTVPMKTEHLGPLIDDMLERVPTFLEPGSTMEEVSEKEAKEAA